ncbi:hypothetical protein VULLAG_LOCUS10290 [Vulpes lagopus]
MATPTACGLFSGKRKGQARAEPPPLGTLSRPGGDEDHHVQTRLPAGRPQLGQSRPSRRWSLPKAQGSKLPKSCSERAGAHCAPQPPACTPHWAWVPGADVDLSEMLSVAYDLCAHSDHKRPVLSRQGAPAPRSFPTASAQKGGAARGGPQGTRYRHQPWGAPGPHS